MKKLMISILVLLSIYNYSVKKEDRNIPVVVMVSAIENNVIEYHEKDLERIIFKEVADFYKSTSKEKINLYNPLENGFKRVTTDEAYTYDRRKTFGLKTITQGDKAIDLSKFDKNSNNVIERDELIILHILEAKDTYEKPIASTIETEDFFLGNLKIERFIQLGLQEVFSNRESLLTPSTVAHEIGHHFGLPDLYDTDYSSKGLGPMSLMSEIHSDQPINFDPWSKLYLGFEKPLKLKEEGIHQIKKEKVYLVETNKNWIYYLIEQRSFQGYDESLSQVMSSDGIFIYKINEKVIDKNIYLNHVNRDEKNMGVKFLGKEVMDQENSIYLKAIDMSHLLIEKQKNN
jgi:M6 family metalloprotease-like protein